MGGTNGHGNGSDGPLMERLVGLVANLREWVRSADGRLVELSEQLALLQQSSDRVEREQKQHNEKLVVITERVTETRTEVGEVSDVAEEIRKDQTDPRGFRTLSRAELEPKNSSGPATAIGRVVDKVPGAWWLIAAKWLLLGGFGAGILRGIQWLVNKR